jgi:hypothetical protein
VSIYARLAAAIMLAAALAGLYWRGYTSGKKSVQAEWNAERLATAENTRLLLMANAKTTGDLQAKADKERASKNAQINSLNLELDESLKRLRNRPERPASDMPKAPGTGGNGTGAELYREDAEFLAREAARADKLRARLNQCIAAYNAAKEALK